MIKNRAGRSSRSHTFNHFIQREIKRYYKLFRSKNMCTIERHLQQCLNRIKTGQQEMASNFPNRKLSAFIFVNNRKYTMIQHSTYMDLKYQLLLNQNFLGLYLIETLLHTPYKIRESEMFKSIKPFKSFISHKLGCGQNNSSSPVSFFNSIKT